MSEIDLGVFVCTRNFRKVIIASATLFFWVRI